MSKPSLLSRIVLAVAKLLSRLPMWLLYAISSALAFIVYHLRLYRYSVVDANLRRAFPLMTRNRRNATIRLFYRHLADSIVETLKLLTISDKALRRKVEFHGVDLVNREIEAGHDIILYLGHYGNWELVPTITWIFPPSDKLVMAQIYRPLRDGAVTGIMDTVRNRFGAENIPQNSAFRTLLRHKQQGRQTITGFIADQRPNSSQLNHWTTFLGLDTPYAVGGEEIGRRLDARYFYLDVKPGRRGHCSFTFIPIKPVEGEKYPYTVGYLRLLEQTIRRDPSPWLWTHKRWSKQRGDAMQHATCNNKQTPE